MRYFKYINPIRDNKGKLRLWDEYDNLSKGEELSCDLNIFSHRYDRHYDEYKENLLAKEQNERS